MTPGEIIKKWDAGDFIESIEMGGLSDGYEIALQTGMIEFLRFCVSNPFIAYEQMYSPLTAAQSIYLKEMEAAVDPIIDYLGLSGAQYGTGRNLAVLISKNGMDSIRQSVKKDRFIKVSKKAIIFEYPELRDPGTERLR